MPKELSALHQVKSSHSGGKEKEGRLRAKGNPILRRMHCCQMDAEPDDPYLSPRICSDRNIFIPRGR